MEPLAVLLFSSVSNGVEVQRLVLKSLAGLTGSIVKNSYSDYLSTAADKQMDYVGGFRRLEVLYLLNGLKHRS